MQAGSHQAQQEVWKQALQNLPNVLVWAFLNSKSATLINSARRFSFPIKVNVNIPNKKILRKYRQQLKETLFRIS